MKFILLLLVSSIYLFSSSAFIEPSELKAKINNENLIILDVTNEKIYAKGHIPGAVMVDVSKFRHQVGPYQLMNSAAEVESEMRCLGINNDSEVVIYAHNIGKEVLKASYVALTLVTNGFTNVSILNGGYPEWVSIYEIDDLISKKHETCKTGNFTAKRNENILVDLAYVKENIGKTPMIEARPMKFYDGSAQSPGVKRLGHITKAKSSFWRDKLDHEYKIKSDDALNSILIKENGLDQNKEVIAYCTGGLEASMNWFILHSHLKFKNVKVYDASMREWGNRDDTPMEK